MCVRMKLDESACWHWCWCKCRCGFCERLTCPLCAELHHKCRLAYERMLVGTCLQICKCARVRTHTHTPAHLLDSSSRSETKTQGGRRLPLLEGPSSEIPIIGPGRCAAPRRRPRETRRGPASSPPAAAPSDRRAGAPASAEGGADGWADACPMVVCIGKHTRGGADAILLRLLPPPLFQQVLLHLSRFVLITYWCGLPNVHLA